jgi:DNA-binding response OmpR family regulator
MTIAWIATQFEPQIIKTFRSAHWGIREFAPIEFMPPARSLPVDIDVIVMHVMDYPLLDLCREFCRQQIAPVLAIVSDLAYAQAALECGVEDFLVTPVEPIEALLRVRKLARITNNIRVGDLEIDLAAWYVSYCGQQIHLSVIEFRLLAALARRAGQMVDHTTILEEVWKWDRRQKPSAQLANYIGRLRRKIEPDLQNPQYIISVPGTGYRLRNQRQWEANQRDAGMPDQMSKSSS